MAVTTGLVATRRTPRSGTLAIGARGAIQVRGKDRVHPEIVRSKQFVHELFSGPASRTAGNDGAP